MTLPGALKTLRQSLGSAREQLAAIDDLASTATQDAEYLLLHALALPRTALYTQPDRPLSAAEQSAFASRIERRLAREPIQYITGTQEFYGLPLLVTPAVLIPRPETELLVEAALHRLPHDAPLRLADVGTGSGAIAVAIASHLSQARITALDLSPAALDLARQNATRHHVADRIAFLESDLFAALPTSAEPFDAILSNPPYIPDSDRPTLHSQVRDFEPATALFAGTDGLDLYRRLIPQAHARLRPGGLLAMELGAGQQAALATLLDGWRDIQFLNDLQGIPRVALARRP